MYSGGHTCSLVTCTSAVFGKKHIETKFHRFPKDHARCAVWISNCKPINLPTIDTDVLNRNHRLCSLHFEDKMYLKKNRLSNQAIPTLFNSRCPPLNSCARKMDQQQSFDGFSLRRVLMNDTERKMIAVEGNFNGSIEPAVVVLEKYAFDEASVMNVCNSSTKLKLNLENDVYKSFSCVPPFNKNIDSNKMDVIYPASEKHILKFSSQPMYLVQETDDIYQTITLPHILDGSLSLQWVYNCLEYKSEKERIKYDTASEDQKNDDNNGFILLPDLKWSGKISELYLLAIVKKRNIKSLRDLTADHLPLLKNILNKGSAAIYKLYGVELSQLRIYVHYQPSFYHFHVHFTYLMHRPPGINVEKAHLLTTLINNIEMQGNYYQKATLNYVIKESDPLFSRFEEKGILRKAKLSEETNNS